MTRNVFNGYRRGAENAEGGVVIAEGVGNIANRFREAWNTFDLAQGIWTVTGGASGAPNVQSAGVWTAPATESGDLVFLDGDVGGSRYLVISKNPLLVDTEVVLACSKVFQAPYRVQLGASMSQRSLGQEFAIESVANVPSELMTAPVAIALSAISQSGTTINATTVLPHGLKPGMRIEIFGVTDSRFNYPYLVVSATVTANTFTVVGGATTLPTLTATPAASGHVIRRSSMGLETSGSSMVFENTTATNASFYTNTGKNGSMASGTLSSAHSVTVGTSLSVQLVNTTGIAAFMPTTQYELLHNIEAISWDDTPVDGNAASTVRVKRTNAVPDPDLLYQTRIRGTNRKAMSAPVAKIVSAVKTGTSTVTITTDVPHGLTTSDFVGIVGIRDQTNFVSTGTSGVQVASIVSATSFTTAFGLAVTATSFGGAVYRHNATVAYPTMGAKDMSVISAQRTSNMLTLTANVIWSGLTIGDYVNVYGVRDNATGADLGLDGVYKVWDVAGTTAMILQPFGPHAVTGADIINTAAGGAVIKRTDFRFAFVRVTEVERHAIEFDGRSEAAAALPVMITSTAAVNISTVAGQIPVTQLGNGNTNRALGVVPAGPVTFADIPVGAKTASGNSGIIVDETGGTLSGVINVSVVSGTTPTLDLSLDESYDGGTTWVSIWQAPRITGVGIITMPPLTVAGRRRWSYVIGGTTPSFTFGIITNKNFQTAPFIRQFFDRTLTGNVIANGQVFSIAGMSRLDVRMLVSTLGTAGTFIVQVSDDGVNWLQISSSITPTYVGAVTPVHSAQISAAFVRVACITAGTGMVVPFISISAVN